MYRKCRPRYLGVSISANVLPGDTYPVGGSHQATALSLICTRRMYYLGLPVSDWKLHKYTLTRRASPGRCKWGLPSPVDLGGSVVLG